MSPLRWHSLARIHWILLLQLMSGAAAASAAGSSGRITVAGDELRVGTNRIWINGANTPWHVWNEFGSDSFDAGWWDNHFQKLHENGINATRVWISCNGENGINIDASGHVSGCTPRFWSNVDSLMQIAGRRQVYIDATILSYDHFSRVHSNYLRWRSMLLNEENIDSLVTNYVAPFAARYKTNQWLWSIDLCNEPDWINETEKCGKLDWRPFQVYVAKAAAAIHAQSPVLVTLGVCMGPKYQGLPPRTNLFSDETLRVLAHGDAGARLDFYSPHYYPWEKPMGGDAFSMAAADYPMAQGRPIVIGECPDKDSAQRTITADYEAAFNRGWQGAMGWSSDGVDSNGSLEDLAPATRAIYAEHPEVVFPGTAGVKGGEEGR